MEKDAVLQIAIAEILPEDFTHPGLRTMTFVFCDDQPNENGQGIEYEDFAEIKRSAIGTPLKLKFFGNDVGNHVGSIPIGYIKDIIERDGEAGEHQLVGVAHLFADEYPLEVKWLSEKFAEGKAPGISWELKYSESVIKHGIEWLKGIITRAATIVKNPAYGNRTTILALASNNDIDDTQLMEELSQLVIDSPKIGHKGGSNRMDEKELEELKQKVADLETAVASKDTEIAELTTKVTTLETSVSEKDTALAAYAEKELIATRTSALAEAGVTLPTEPEKLAAKQAFIAGLSEEAFTEYKTDLAEAIASAKKSKDTKETFASLRTPAIPKFDASASAEDRPNFGEMRERFRDFRFTPQPE